ncbi:hypothetical protein C8J55DRAFT_423376 [Lentinula edodes]|uniref:ATP-dependent DNA helicase n=1 Tax=Lentinula lateritia TaxID=40482 RepID=A0A9W9ARC0_9AGAR|nr:hypothetical protein C8J55DRAFT_423376 [Lentinula edodes]
MRQKNMTAEDNKFRTVLENMRYKKCTPSDIAFLRSRISANVPGADSICKSEFRNVPMITALNIDKDEINQIGCERFAAENMSNLTNFYSEDVARQSNDNALDEKRTKKKLLSIKEMTDDVQKLLWSLNHSSSDSHVPSKLSLCVNMPVMIRRNLATELCITKGQEGTVYGWQTKKGSRGQLMLDVLFIKLINLPDGKIVEITGLPKNVVPVYSTTNSMQITLPNGCAVNVTREQVEVLPNFAMTDFASQGKTRPINVVDINNCKDYHGIYTALSRGSTASGTLLIQGFSPRKLTEHKYVDTREEFRELEILDEITRLQYENQICSSIKGTYRQDLIKAYQKWKGKHYVPKNVPSAIKWSSKDPWKQFDLDEVKWQIIMKSDTNNQSADNQNFYIPSMGLFGKRKLHISPEATPENSPMKKKKSVGYIMPKFGPTWENNSCAYDSVIAVFLAIWSSNPTVWYDTFMHSSNEVQVVLAQHLEKYNNGIVTLNEVRDAVHTKLYSNAPSTFEWGKYTVAGLICDALLNINTTVFTGTYTCPKNQNHLLDRPNLTLHSSLLDSTEPYDSISDWIHHHYHTTRHKCSSCNTNIHILYSMNVYPPIIAFQLSQPDQGKDIPYIEMTLTVQDASNKNQKYSLSGIIYFGEAHYTARIIDQDGKVWYYDGIADNGRFSYNGNINTDNIQLHKRGQKQAAVAIYALDIENLNS